MANLKDRDKREDSFRKRLTSLSAKHRKELEKLLGDPPNPDNVPQEFWDRVERETEEQITLALLLIFLMGFRQHAPKEPKETALDEAKKYATEQARKLASQFTVHSKKLANKIRDIGKKETKAKVKSIFGPERAEGIAVTETTAATSQAGERAVVRTVGFTSNDTWFTENDARVCPICAPLHNTKRVVWGAQFPEGPPAHPVCRCWIHYALEKRGKVVIGGDETPFIAGQATPPGELLKKRSPKLRP